MTQLSGVRKPYDDARLSQLTFHLYTLRIPHSRDAKLRSAAANHPVQHLSPSSRCSIRRSSSGIHSEPRLVSLIYRRHSN